MITSENPYVVQEGRLPLFVANENINRTPEVQQLKSGFVRGPVLAARPLHASQPLPLRSSKKPKKDPYSHYLDPLLADLYRTEGKKLPKAKTSKKAPKAPPVVATPLLRSYDLTAEYNSVQYNRSRPVAEHTEHHRTPLISRAALITAGTTQYTTTAPSTALPLWESEIPASAELKPPPKPLPPITPEPPSTADNLRLTNMSSMDNTAWLLPSSRPASSDTARKHDFELELLTLRHQQILQRRDEQLKQEREEARLRQIERLRVEEEARVKAQAAHELAEAARQERERMVLAALQAQRVKDERLALEAKLQAKADRLRAAVQAAEEERQRRAKERADQLLKEQRERSAEKIRQKQAEALEARIRAERLLAETAAAEEERLRKWQEEREAARRAKLANDEREKQRLDDEALARRARVKMEDKAIEVRYANAKAARNAAEAEVRLNVCAVLAGSVEAIAASFSVHHTAECSIVGVHRRLPVPSIKADADELDYANREVAAAHVAVTAARAAKTASAEAANKYVTTAARAAIAASYRPSDDKLTAAAVAEKAAEAANQAAATYEAALLRADRRHESAIAWKHRVLDRIEEEKRQRQREEELRRRQEQLIADQAARAAEAAAEAERKRLIAERIRAEKEADARDAAERARLRREAEEAEAQRQEALRLERERQERELEEQLARIQAEEDAKKPQPCLQQIEEAQEALVIASVDADLEEEGADGKRTWDLSCALEIEEEINGNFTPVSTKVWKKEDGPLSVLRCGKKRRLTVKLRSQSAGMLVHSIQSVSFARIGKRKTYPRSAADRRFVFDQLCEDATSTKMEPLYVLDGEVNEVSAVFSMPEDEGNPWPLSTINEILLIPFVFKLRIIVNLSLGWQLTTTDFTLKTLIQCQHFDFLQSVKDSSFYIYLNKFAKLPDQPHRASYRLTKNEAYNPSATVASEAAEEDEEQEEKAPLYTNEKGERVEAKAVVDENGTPGWVFTDQHGVDHFLQPYIDEDGVTRYAQPSPETMGSEKVVFTIVCPDGQVRQLQPYLDPDGCLQYAPPVIDGDRIEYVGVNSKGDLQYLWEVDDPDHEGGKIWQLPPLPADDEANEANEDDGEADVPPCYLDAAGSVQRAIASVDADGTDGWVYTDGAGEEQVMHPFVGATGVLCFAQPVYAGNSSGSDSGGGGGEQEPAYYQHVSAAGECVRLVPYQDTSGATQYAPPVQSEDGETAYVGVGGDGQLQYLLFEAAEDAAAEADGEGRASTASATEKASSRGRWVLPPPSEEAIAAAAAARVVQYVRVSADGEEEELADALAVVDEDGNEGWMYTDARTGADVFLIPFVGPHGDTCYAQAHEGAMVYVTRDGVVAELARYLDGDGDEQLAGPAQDADTGELVYMGLSDAGELVPLVPSVDEAGREVYSLPAPAAGGAAAAVVVDEQASAAAAAAEGVGGAVGVGALADDAARASAGAVGVSDVAVAGDDP